MRITVITSQPSKKVAKDEREYRTCCKKTATAEARNELLGDLIKKDVGLKELEEFVEKERGKLKGKAKGISVAREMVRKLMKEKLRDNIKLVSKLRKRRDRLRAKLELTWGKNSKKLRNLVKDVKSSTGPLRQGLRKKNIKKVRYLVCKYGNADKYEVRASMTKDEIKEYGMAKVFTNKCKLAAEAMKGPVVVCREGEEIELSEGEKKVLMLGPKFCVLKNLDEGEFEGCVEECILKYKWDKMGEDGGNKKHEGDKDLDELLEALLDEEEAEKLEEDLLEIEAKRRTVYDELEGTMNLSKKRVTDMKGNTRVIFPPEGKDLEEESKLDMVRREIMGEYRKYVKEKCKKGGKQTSNLTKEEQEGLQSLKKRVKEGEIIVLPTDKSGRFALMTRETYEVAGAVHTKKDLLVNNEVVKETQSILNGNVSMLLKVFNVGKNWNHVDRCRETMINLSMVVCPLYLLYKDHKGWSLNKGPVPPTRPVASGNQGMNLHLSEIISDLLEPVVERFDQGCEVISTEEMIAKVLKMDRSLVDWSSKTWWEQIKTVDGKYIACGSCMGSPDYEYDEDNPELCMCKDMVKNNDGRDVCKDMMGNNGMYDDAPEDPGCKDMSGNNSMEDVKTGPTKATINFVRMSRERTWSEMYSWDETGDLEGINSTMVPPEKLQDFENPMVLVGCDVESLYPNLDREATIAIVKKMIIECDVQWEEIDWIEATRFIALNWTRDQCRASSLRKVLPIRRKNNGVRPGVKGVGPMGKEPHDQEQWRFPPIKLTEEDKKEILGQVIAICVDILFKNHLYTFGGDVFRQLKGGPIGLRATCAIARMVMCEWDRLWIQKLDSLNIKTELMMRYMDDGRTFLYAIRPGWRMVGDRLLFKKTWEMEDWSICPTTRTAQILGETMQGVVEGLKFTIETKNDFEDGKLPTLDINLFITEENRIGFNFYEKPTVSNLAILKRSALPENGKIQSLSNEVVRRLLNIKEGEKPEFKGAVLDRYAVKLLTSGYDIEQVGRIILGGVRGFENKKKRCKQEKRPLYRTAQESGAGRRRKKLVGKTSWFKGSKGNQMGDRTLGGKKKNGKWESKGAVPKTKLKTRTVLFVEKTPQGELASRIRELLGRLEDNIGFKIKVAERSGSSLKSMFPLTNVWGGVHCGREDCIPCSQGGEEIGNCKVRSVVYESACKRCNPEVGKKGPLKTPCTDPPSLYVGETGRSLHERSREHWDSYRNGSKDSHILKHHLLHHNGEGEPEMIFKVVGKYRSALSRQVGEAVKIRRRGGEGSLLNSKGEFNRCKITRLTLEEQPKKSVQEDQSVENEDQLLEGEQYGEQIILGRREQADKRSLSNIGKYQEASKGAKRTNSIGEEPKKSKKKRKFELVGSR